MGNKLWDKGTPLDALIERYTVGDDPILDRRLIPYDVAGSKAHATMLYEIGVLDADELATLHTGLDAIAADPGFEITQADEDVHTAIERALGEAGKKLPTGRSRNDQVLVDLRLWQRDAVQALKAATTSAAAAFDAFAVDHADVPIPGYTHLQRAMPSTVGRWSQAWATLLRQDLALLDAAAAMASASPLGSAAGYGVPDVLPIDRARTAALLGFDSVLEPPEAAQLTRGKAEATLLFACAELARDVGRWAWDVCLYCTREFGFFRLPPDFTTGSSIMPQKRNPDVLELTRAKAAVVRSALTELQALSSPLPSGYHRDLQLLKGPLFRGFDVTLAMLEICAHVMRGLAVDEAACTSAMTEELYATERAYELVREGVPFREAYRRIGEKY